MRDDRDLYLADMSHPLDELRAALARRHLQLRLARAGLAVLLALGAGALAIGAMLGWGHC